MLSNREILGDWDKLTNHQKNRVLDIKATNWTDTRVTLKKENTRKTVVVIEFKLKGKDYKTAITVSNNG